MKLINTLLITLFFITLSACACTKPALQQSVELHPSLTINSYMNCTTDERYPFPMFNTYYVVSRHSKPCLGINDLFTVTWVGEKTELQKVTALQLTILYAQSMGPRNHVNYDYEFLKEVSDQETGEKHIVFYRLISTPLEQKDPVTDTSP